MGLAFMFYWIQLKYLLSQKRFTNNVNFSLFDVGLKNRCFHNSLVIIDN